MVSNKLYIIGGSLRCGKTTILNEVIRKKPMLGISSDAIRAGVRYLNKHGRIHESENMVEDQLPWEMLIGLIQRYDHQNIPLIIEGVVLTPERVQSLELKNLELRVAFVGFSSDEYIEHVIQHSINAKDWVYDKIVSSEGKVDEVRSMLQGVRQKSIVLQGATERYGYKFFSTDGHSFEEHKKSVVDYLLN